MKEIVKPEIRQKTKGELHEIQTHRLLDRRISRIDFLDTRQLVRGWTIARYFMGVEVFGSLFDVVEWASDRGERDFGDRPFRLRGEVRTAVSAIDGGIFFIHRPSAIGMAIKRTQNAAHHFSIADVGGLIVNECDAAQFADYRAHLVFRVLRSVGHLNAAHHSVPQQCKVDAPRSRKDELRIFNLEVHSWNGGSISFQS